MRGTVATRRMLIPNAFPSCPRKAKAKSAQAAPTMATILNDYVEAAIMLDYNDRDVAAAWY